MTLVWFLTRRISWAAGVLLSVTERREKQIEVPQRLAFGWSNGLQEHACICLSIVKAGSGGAHSQGREIRALLHSTKCSLAKRWTNAIGIQKMYWDRICIAHISFFRTSSYINETHVSLLQRILRPKGPLDHLV